MNQLVKLHHVVFMLSAPFFFAGCGGSSGDDTNSDNNSADTEQSEGRPHLDVATETYSAGWAGSWLAWQSGPAGWGVGIGYGEGGSGSGGGSSGSGGGGGSGRPSIPNVRSLDCDGDFDPDTVYLMGTYRQDSSDFRAIIHPTNPTSSCPGFDYFSDKGYVRTDGSYIYPLGTQLLQFAPDPLIPESAGGTALWSYPTFPENNDTVIYEPRRVSCSSSQGITHFIQSPDRNEFVFSCGGYTWYREDESTIEEITGGERVHAVYSDGSVLVARHDFYGRAIAGTSKVISARGSRIEIIFEEGLQSEALLITTRHARRDELWLVIWDFTGYHLWLLEDDTAVYEGTFAEFVDDDRAYYSPSSAALDDRGNLWFLRSERNDFAYGITVHPLAPGRAVEVYYTEDDAQTASSTWNTLESPPVSANSRSFLFTGP